MHFKQTLCALALFCATVALAAEEDAPEYSADKFKEEVPKTNHFVMFYAPWCGHCKRLHPTWEELGAKFNKEGDVVVAKVDCTVETALCSDNDVTGYPTLKFFKKDEEADKAEKYRGARDLSALNKFIGKQLGQEVEEIVIEPEEATVDKGLYVLNDKSFANHVKTGDHFIKFYAPWCGHCQKLAPTWEKLASEFENDKVVKVSKLDCTVAQSICQENDVKGYPTLAYFRNGKKVETYRGARNIDELRDFLKSMQDAKPAGDQEADKVPTEDAKGAAKQLNADNFKDSVESGVTFVKFFAPWCGHCKRLAPVWDELAGKFSEDETVTIAKVDCTSDDNKNKELCNDEGVNGFPTLNIYKDGKKAEEYSGKRSIDDLEKFVKKHAVKKDEL